MGAICDLCLEDRLWCFGETYCLRLQGDQTGSNGRWSDVASRGRDCFVLGECLLLFSFGERMRGVHDLLEALQVGRCLACLPVLSSVAADCRLCLSRLCSGNLWPDTGPFGTVWSRTLRTCCREPASSWALSKAGYGSNQLPLHHDLQCRNTWLPTALRHLKVLRYSSVQLLLWTDSVLGVHTGLLFCVSWGLRVKILIPRIFILFICYFATPTYATFMYIRTVLYVPASRTPSAGSSTPIFKTYSVIDCTVIHFIVQRAGNWCVNIASFTNRG